MAAKTVDTNRVIDYFCISIDCTYRTTINTGIAYKKSAKLGNLYSSFALARIVLKEDNPDPNELKKAIEFLSAVTKSDDSVPKHITRMLPLPD